MTKQISDLSQFLSANTKAKATPAQPNAKAKPARTTKPAKARTTKPAANTTNPAQQPQPSVTVQALAGIAAATQPAPKAKGRTATNLTLVIAKEFKPRTNNVDGDKAKHGNFAQLANWEAVTKALVNGEITYEAAVQAVVDAAKAGGYEATCNARGFVQGRVRGGHLAPKQA